MTITVVAGMMKFLYFQRIFFPCIHLKNIIFLRGYFVNVVSGGVVIVIKVVLVITFPYTDIILFQSG